MSSPSPVRRLLGVGAALAFVTVGGLAACSSSGSDATADTSTTSSLPRVDGTSTTTDDTSTTDGEPTDTTEGSDRTTSTTEPVTSTTETNRPPEGDEAAYVEAMREYLEDDDDVFGQEAIDCMATDLVGLIGVDRFRAAGIDPVEAGDPFDELDIDIDTAEDMYEIVDDCSSGIREKMIEVFTADAGPGARPCLEKALTDAVVREVFVSAFQGVKPSDELITAVGACA